VFDLIPMCRAGRLEFFQDMWDSYNHEKNKSAALRIQLERARKVCVVYLYKLKLLNACQWQCSSFGKYLAVNVYIVL
jgi:hypothetical protein